jgi:hypothetical protein
MCFIDQGGQYILLYAVLKRGSLYFYKSKEALDDGDERLFAINLKYYRVSTRKKDFADDPKQVQ